MTILHIDSSINGENSASRAVSQSIVEQLKTAQWGEEVVYRDLASDPLSHLTLDAFADTSVLDEFLAADTIVIGAPMYNFTLPSQLKAWIDRILIAETISATRPTAPKASPAAGASSSPSPAAASTTPTRPPPRSIPSSAT